MPKLCKPLMLFFKLSESLYKRRRKKRTYAFEISILISSITFPQLNAVRMNEFASGTWIYRLTNKS